MNPIDLLPIKRPLEDTSDIPPTYFYDNVIKPLIPDILKLEMTGIPINLDKVEQVQKTVDNVLENVSNTLSNSILIKRFIDHENSVEVSSKTEELEHKKKKAEDFIKPFNIKNKIHRSFVVNQYLLDSNKPNMILNEWTIKDLKKLNEIISSNFIKDLLDENIKEYMEDTISKAMYSLAQSKADSFNKNRIEQKQESLRSTNLVNSFNPASSNQKRDFFAYYGIESEQETKANQAKWDRKELERLMQLLNIMIEEGENNGKQA